MLCAIGLNSWKVPLNSWTKVQEEVPVNIIMLCRYLGVIWFPGSKFVGHFCILFACVENTLLYLVGINLVYLSVKLSTEKEVKHLEGKPRPSCKSGIPTAGSILPFLLSVAGKYLLTPWLRSSFSYLNEEVFHVVSFMYLINNIF